MTWWLASGACVAAGGAVSVWLWWELAHADRGLVPYEVRAHRMAWVWEQSPQALEEQPAMRDAMAVVAMEEYRVGGFYPRP